MINLSLTELKLIAKSRSVKDYKNKSKEYLSKILSRQKLKASIFKSEIEEIKKDFSELTHRFSKSKLNEFIKSLYNLKIRKNLIAPKIRETKNSLYNPKNYYDYDDTEYEGTRDIRNLFVEVDKDYYKAIKTKSAFSGNYIEYERKGDKNKNLPPKEYLHMIRPYLGDMTNDYKTSGEWEIQLTIRINFISLE